MAATTKDQRRFNDIIAGHPYNPAKWECDYKKFLRILDDSLAHPGKHKPEDIEARAQSLCMDRFGAIYEDLRDYYKDYELPIIRLLLMLFHYFLNTKLDYIDPAMTDQEILSSIRLSLRQYADDHAEEIFGVNPNKNPEQQQYNKAPIPYKDTFDMPIDKINNDLYELLHTEGMKKKYIVSSPDNNPVYVTTILAPFIPEEEKREEIEKGIALLQELAYSVDVLQAAYQLYRPVARVEYTAAQVIRVLQTEYKKNHNHVPETSEKEVEQILDAWYNMMIDIGAEEQIKQWHRGDPANAPKSMTKGNFYRVLPVAFGKATYTTRNAAGDIVTVTKKTYIFNPDGHITPPPTLEYSQSIAKQIAPFPDALLNPPIKFNKLSKTINTHLLRYIDAMKYRNRSNHILYTTLAHEIGYYRQQDINNLELIPPKMKQTLRDGVKKHLNYFVQQGYISSWSEYPESGRSKDGVVITLPGTDQDTQQPAAKRKPRPGKKEEG